MIMPSLKKDVDYTVDEKAHGGLHQAIEAKENVTVEEECRGSLSVVIPRQVCSGVGARWSG